MKLAQWLPHLTLALCQDVPGKAYHQTMLATHIIKSEMLIWGMVDAWEMGVSSSGRFPGPGRCMGEGC